MLIHPTFNFNFQVHNNGADTRKYFTSRNGRIQVRRYSGVSGTFMIFFQERKRKPTNQLSQSHLKNMVASSLSTTTQNMCVYRLNRPPI